MDSTSHNKPTTHQPEHRRHQPSNSELLGSAKLVAEAAKSALHHETDKIDRSKVADAAADILGAASHYGKLEESGLGKYVDKAENYLHQYHSSHSTTTVSAESGHSTTTTTTTHTTTHSSHADDDGHSGGGYGDYIKMAESFLKKR